MENVYDSAPFVTPFHSSNTELQRTTKFLTISGQQEQDENGNELCVVSRELTKQLEPSDESDLEEHVKVRQRMRKTPNTEAGRQFSGTKSKEGVVSIHHTCRCGTCVN